MQWSTQQQAIFHWFGRGGGNLVVRARAGTGKTTTLLEGVNHAPENRILLAAYNKSIARELDQRLQNPNATAQTLHAAGFRIVRRWWEGIRLAQGSQRAMTLAADVAGPSAPDAVLRAVAKLSTLGRETVPFARSAADLVVVAWEHDCVLGEEWEEEGYDVETIAELAWQAMGLAKERPTTGIDFADMLFLPLVHGWVRARHDLVVIDEAQDLNFAQLELARRLSAHRVAVVGDNRQAIYGFRGADAGSLDRLKRELAAHELSLTVTYRCPSLIVELAREMVPDYQAAPSSPRGCVETISEHRLPRIVEPGQVVLSRMNAPLVPLCLRTLREGKPARIEGRDIARDLSSLVRYLSEGPAKSSMPRFLDRVERWETREVARARNSGVSGAEARIVQTQDKAETLRFLAEGVTGVREIEARLSQLFEARQEGVVFSSIHRAKGREWDTVYLLRQTLRSQPEEEQNIRYVGITRAKKRLVWVD